MNAEEIIRRYECDGLFSRIIDAPAEEAVKHGIALNGNGAAYCEAALDRLEWGQVFITGVEWARLFGGSIAVMLINDGRGLEEPLNLPGVRSIDGLRVYELPLLQDVGARYEVLSMYGAFQVHKSRCLVFRNGVMPENAKNRQYELWGVPEYERIEAAITRAETAHSNAARMLDRSIQAVYRMRGLEDVLATEDGESLVMRRLQVLDMARSILNTTLIDAEGEDCYTLSAYPANVGEVLTASRLFLSGVSNIPYKLLFGKSPSGFKNTDDTSMEIYYNYVESIQHSMIKDNLRRLLSVVSLVGINTGAIAAPCTSFKFRPLWSTDALEEAESQQYKAAAELDRAKALQAYVSCGALKREDVRRAMRRGR